jgi:hypothetical protein
MLSARMHVQQVPQRGKAPPQWVSSFAPAASDGRSAFGRE